MANPSPITTSLASKTPPASTLTAFERWLSATVFQGRELPFIDNSYVDAAMANVAAGKPAYIVTGYGNNIASAMLDSLNGKSCCGLEPSSRLSRLHTQVKAKKPAWLERYTWQQMLSWLTPVNDAGREALAWEISLHSGQAKYQAAA